MAYTLDEVERMARAYLGPRQKGIPEKVYEKSLKRLIFVTKQWNKGLRFRNGRWRKIANDPPPAPHDNPFELGTLTENEALALMKIMSEPSKATTTPYRIPRVEDEEQDAEREEIIKTYFLE